MAAWEDGDNRWATSGATRGLKWSDGIVYTSVAAARTIGALGATSNLVAGKDRPLTDAAWLDPA